MGIIIIQPLFQMGILVFFSTIIDPKGFCDAPVNLISMIKHQIQLIYILFRTADTQLSLVMDIVFGYFQRILHSTVADIFLRSPAFRLSLDLSANLQDSFQEFILLVTAQ